MDLVKLGTKSVENLFRFILLSLLTQFLWIAGIESKDFLIWDAEKDFSKERGRALWKAFQDRGYHGDYGIDIAPYLDSLNIYCAIFVYLGSNPDTTLLKDTRNVVSHLCKYLSRGGNLYIEGGETWAAWDNPRRKSQKRSSMEGRQRVGRGMFDYIYGINGNFSQKMVFPYGEKNQWIDYIKPESPSETLFINWPPYSVCAVSYDDPGIGYKTIGRAFELGGFKDPFSFETPMGANGILADSVMHFFGCSDSPTYWSRDQESHQEDFVFPSLILPNPKPPLLHNRKPLFPLR